VHSNDENSRLETDRNIDCTVRNILGFGLLSINDVKINSKEFLLNLVMMYKACLLRLRLGSGFGLGNN